MAAPTFAEVWDGVTGRLRRNALGLGVAPDNIRAAHVGTPGDTPFLYTYALPNIEYPTDNARGLPTCAVWVRIGVSHNETARDALIDAVALAGRVRKVLGGLGYINFGNPSLVIESDASDGMILRMDMYAMYDSRQPLLNDQEVLP